MNGPNFNPSNAQAMQLAKSANPPFEMLSAGGQLAARCVKGRTDRWLIRKVGQHRGKLAKAFVTLDTRNKKVVQAMLDTLETFHLKDAL